VIAPFVDFSPVDGPKISPGHRYTALILATMPLER